MSYAEDDKHVAPTHLEGHEMRDFNDPNDHEKHGHVADQDADAYVDINVVLDPAESKRLRNRAFKRYAMISLQR